MRLPFIGTGTPIFANSVEKNGTAKNGKRIWKGKVKNMANDDYDGWVFKWLKSRDGGPGYYCVHRINENRSMVIDGIVKAWQRDGESRQHTWRRIRRMGGRVVKVKLVEIK